MGNDWLQLTFLENTLESLLYAIAIILTGLVFQRFISRKLSQLIFKIFKKYSFGVSGEKFVQLLVKPFSVFVLLITIYIACLQLHYPESWHLVPEHKAGLKMTIWKLFQLSIVLSITWIVLRLVDYFSLVMLHRASLTESKSDDQLVPFFKESLKIIIIIFSVFFMLGTIFKINIASLIAGLGIGGLAFALAAKDTLENLIGSFVIFLDKPFVVGDTVKVGNVEGKVEKIGFRSTQIRSVEKSLVIVPNKRMTEADLDNLSEKSMTRATFPLGIHYNTPLNILQDFMEEIRKYLQTNEKLRVDPVVRVNRIQENTIELLILFFVMTNEWEEYIMVREEVLLSILKIAQQKEIQFAYPARELKQA